MSREAVDFVITWVNGADQQWLARRAAASSTRDSQWLGDAGNRGEGFLKWQLRSIAQNAPWVRTVHLVTEGRLPDWLDTSDPRLQVVRDSQLNPHGVDTFNSHAVEASITEIPGLAEHFVYLNDDFFLGRPIGPDFYFREGLPYANPSPLYLTHGDLHAHAMLNATSTLNSLYGKRDYLRGLGRGVLRAASLDTPRSVTVLASRRIPPTVDMHLPTPLRRSVTAEVFTLADQQLDDVRRSVFRSPTDIAPIYLATIWHIATGRFFPISRRAAGRWISMANAPERAIVELINSDAPQLCVNDNVRSDDAEVTGAVVAALDARWPQPSPFELSPARVSTPEVSWSRPSHSIDPSPAAPES